MFKKGEVYRCTDAACGCEITITQDAKRSKAGHDHRCCCGLQMSLKT